MARILLCHPLFLSQNAAEMAASSPYFPLGILYLAAYVRQRGHEVAVFDGTFETDEGAFEERLQREAPEVVGISVLMPTRPVADRLAGVARQYGATVFAGGPEPTRDPAALLACPDYDFVIHHEGEQTLASLLDLYDAGALTYLTVRHEPGIAFRNPDGEVVINQPRPPIENLDELPLPARDLIDMERYLDSWRQTNGYASMTLSATRGCPYNCDWCRDAVHGAAYRQRSPENVAAEMRFLKQRYQIDRLRLIDDVDGIDRAWIDAWADAAAANDAAIPFEALNDLQRQDLPLLDVREPL